MGPGACLLLKQLTAQQRQFLKRNCVLGDYRNVNPDREFDPSANTVDAIERKQTDILILLETGQHVFHNASSSYVKASGGDTWDAVSVSGNVGPCRFRSKRRASFAALFSLRRCSFSFFLKVCDPRPA